MCPLLWALSVAARASCVSMEGISLHRLNCWTSYVLILAWPSLLWVSLCDQTDQHTQVEAKNPTASQALPCST